MSIYPYETANGRRYRVAIRRRDLTHFKKGFRTKEAAENYERLVLDDADKGILRKGPDVSFADYAEWWLEQRSSLKPSTLRSYRSMLDKLLPVLGERTLAAITPVEVAESVPRRGTDGELSDKTRLNYMVLLKTMFQDAVDYELLSRSPAAKLSRPRFGKREMDYLNPGEIGRLLEAADEKSRPVIMTAIYTGLRRGELFGLRWDDVEDNYIYVRRSRYAGRDVTPKSESSKRRVPIGKELRYTLKLWRLQSPGECVFPFNADNFCKRDFERALRKAKLRKIRFHDLRHTYAALMVAQGTNPKRLQKLMGHASFNTTMDTYAHLYPDDDAGVAEGLEQQVKIVPRTQVSE